jgi:site-specific DNA-methyltransferase (adenine-specific)
MNKIYNSDCFDVFPLIKNKSIDLVLVDLPYGQTACDWDIKINLDNMWKELKRISKDNCQFVFFTTTKFGVELINSNPKWFRYDLVWEKHNAVGFLNANKMPLRNHEMIYIFNSCGEDDVELTRNLEMRKYGNDVYKFIKKPMKQINKDLSSRMAEHFFYFKTSQFLLPTQGTYNKLIELYKINEMEGFKPFEELTKEKIVMTYNPQKTPGKPWKGIIRKERKNVYGLEKTGTSYNETGDRHPKSVLKFHQNGEKLHPTQKPLELCEWLIKTYSNEGDLVLDFCMGSGTTIQACINTNRSYIGVEKNEKIFEVAKQRLFN